MYQLKYQKPKLLKVYIFSLLEINQDIVIFMEGLLLIPN